MRRQHSSDEKMAALADLLDPTLKKMGIQGAVRDAQIAEVFAEVVGAALSPMCNALRVDGKALVISCVNPALAHQLQMEAPKIIGAVNSRLGAQLITRLRFAAS